MLQVFNRNGIKTPVLRRYVEQREQIIGTLLTKYPRFNRERVKNAFIVTMHNGNYMTNVTGVAVRILDEFRIELKSSAMQLTRTACYRDLWKQALDRTPRRTNP